MVFIHESKRIYIKRKVRVLDNKMNDEIDSYV